MTSVESPTRLKVSQRFAPRVKFHVYELELPDVFIASSKVTVSENLRRSDALCAPTNAEYKEKYIFQQGTSSYSCYLLDPQTYPPNMKGYKSFLDKFKYHATLCGERYSSNNVRRNKVGDVTRVAICCSHSKHEDKRVTKNKVIDESVFKYKFDTINNSRKTTSREKGHQSLPRRTNTFSCQARCTLSTVNIHFGKHCLFLICSENTDYHTNHLPLLKHEVATHLDKERIEEIQVMAHAKSSAHCIHKGMIALHNGDIHSTKNIMKHKAKHIAHKINNNSDDLLYGLNDTRSAVQVLQDLGCRVIKFTDESSYEPQAQKKVKRSCRTFDDAEGGVECNSTYIRGNASHLDHEVNSKLTGSKYTFVDTCIETTSSEHISKDDLKTFIESTNPGREKKHTVCIAWVTKEQCLLARAFCQSVHMDATHKVCIIDNLLMFTVTVNDTMGNTYVVARFWIPNQQQWMFRYILLEVLPKLFDEDFCNKVKSFVCDGDDHLIKMIHLAIRMKYKNATWVPCSWHLSNRSIRAHERFWHLKRHVSPYVKEWFCRFLEGWLCTFMVPGRGIEDDDEYIVSKCLLLGVINSVMITNCFTKDTILALNDFLQTRIFVHEADYVAHKYSTLFNKEAHSNSPHEGTNNGLKNSSDRIHGKDSLASSATKKMGEYDRRRFSERSIAVTDNFDKVSLHTKVFQHVTKFIVGVLNFEKSQGNCYIVGHGYNVLGDLSLYFLRNGEDLSCDEDEYYEVGEIDDDNDDDDDEVEDQCLSTNLGQCTANPLPPTKRQLAKMSMSTLKDNMESSEVTMLANKLESAKILHVRQITFQEIGGSIYLNCSCHMDNRCGTICRHKFSAFNAYLKPLGLFHDFDSYSVHIINWKSYNFYANRCEQNLSNMELEEWTRYQCLVQEGFTGTLCKHNEHMTIPKLNSMMNNHFGSQSDPLFRSKGILEWYTTPAIMRVTNFSKQFVKECVERYGLKHYDTINMMSQVSNVGFDIQDNDYHPLENMNDVEQLKSHIASTQAEYLSARDRELEFTKKMHEIKGMFDFNDEMLFKSLMSSLTIVQTHYANKQNSRSKQSLDRNCCDFEDFPNRCTGRKTKSRSEG